MPEVNPNPYDLAGIHKAAKQRRAKPEGPAQEPAWICPHGISAQRIMPDGGFYNPCPRCAQLVTPQIRELERENNALTDELTKLYEQATEHVETIILARELLKSSAQPPATPAPSQPAGAREAAEEIARACAEFDGTTLPSWREYVKDRIAPLLAQPAAAKDVEIAELKERNAELNMLAYKWMVAHDSLAAKKPYEFPRPSDVPESIARAKAAERERDSLRAEYKNFHRSLCDRFGYTHDPVDWRRDLVSLEEHINAALKAGKE